MEQASKLTINLGQPCWGLVGLGDLALPILQQTSIARAEK